ncbi:hypothetical protein LSH36_694g00043 [Paralvinella palmiformis]|uniref:Fucolectin tachylectin-4 pentraxin-1 domain-containing protein n=1 Tax=Paralvinella palmiformis TaxID=53620 RepID=A0AAD9J286_9ANNE|nr:hypothetical protein LSH36_694g00043 [Paralvinella palmiformis]
MSPLLAGFITYTLVTSSVSQSSDKGIHEKGSHLPDIKDGYNTYGDLGNVALHKPAYQLGSRDVGTADRAVDGILDSRGSDDYSFSVCANPDSGSRGNGPAQWWVDLEATYRIHKVTVFNTCDMEESVNRGGSHTFICDHKEGRYVFVRKLEGSREQQLLTLCEVMVDGIQVSAPTPFMSAAMGTTAMIQTTPSSGVNIASHRTAYQTGTRGLATADKAVDGRYDVNNYR